MTEENEEILKRIYSIPMWVKNEKDILKFAIHMQYRCLQYQEMVMIYSSLYSKKLDELNNPEDYEFCKKLIDAECKYNKAYNNTPFSQAEQWINNILENIKSEENQLKGNYSFFLEKYFKDSDLSKSNLE